jgi:hypothetical protein
MTCDICGDTEIHDFTVTWQNMTCFFKIHFDSLIRTVTNFGKWGFSLINFLVSVLNFTIRTFSHIWSCCACKQQSYFLAIVLSQAFLWYHIQVVHYDWLHLQLEHMLGRRQSKWKRVIATHADVKVLIGM